MGMSEVISTSALVLIGVILLVLLMQYLRLREIWTFVAGCRSAARWAKIREMENRELKRALRAERARVQELKVRLELS
ncbi:hypothetical protein D7M10_24450 [Pseudomonas fluorescens]|jgi:hypothetical protein|uniref:hypothetical protein n=1 Tax=Pseudomonas TaxID=286 RepID=UPI0007CFFDA5|nr:MULTISPECIES: hypothetical protein [Pseudomonas]AYG10047.1 hypothetical protein D7M10_24450 [Pseudomonas fluorescens]OAE15719.1 hypothetical protein A2T76_16320 [Pseudomonas brenneri]MBJ2240937.1 hypothetical protein [Pseudomonas sp. MF6768]MBJ2288341.1 hypothetical protein [Pseudomonas sp. MF5691]MBK3435996.1 hypothetical protein [Pseudomonas sp. MF7448]